MTFLLIVIPLSSLILSIVHGSFVGYNLYEDKSISLSISIINLLVSLVSWILFDYSQNQYQFVKGSYKLREKGFSFGLDGLSIFFVGLATIIIPIAILSNWINITTSIITYANIILILETSLLGVFLVLDMFIFYVFFESILMPLFILIGLYGSKDKVRASFYLFLYTLSGSLFMLLSIIHSLSSTGASLLDALFKFSYKYAIQILTFIGIFIAFAIKTPTIFLNNWLLKAHVESPISGSIILAAIAMAALNLAISWKNLVVFNNTAVFLLVSSAAPHPLVPPFTTVSQKFTLPHPPFHYSLPPSSLSTTTS